MSEDKIKRILVYTHNSIGLGHAFRILALITGMKKWRPDIEFLVVSGTSVPQIFFSEGIEVIKLPSIKLDIDREDDRMQSRYLSGFSLDTIFDFRQRIIMATFDFFQPDALIVEHNMTGQMSELIPLLMRKWMRKGGAADFALAHICRGIMKWMPLLHIPYENPRHKSESINVGALYDFMYVLEDREVIDINRQFLGNDPELEPKIQYLGKITNRVLSEIPGREETLDKFGLPDKPIILISLGRNNRVPVLCDHLLNKCCVPEFGGKFQFVFVSDPYMGNENARTIKNNAQCRGAKILPFMPDLVDLIAHSELVISRAGYNTVNEILLTGTRAMLVPESHGSGEQEMRVRSISARQSEKIRVLSEEEFLTKDLCSEILSLLCNGRNSQPAAFDKYVIGKKIIDDIEKWKTQTQKNVS